MALYPSLAFEADESVEADELFGGVEADEADESDEAARRPRRLRAPIRTPQRGGNVPARPQPGFATRAELVATANRLDGKIGVISTGVKAMDGRIRTIDSEQGRLRSALSAETKKREALMNQVNSLQQMSMLLPLLTQTDTTTLKDSSGSNLQIDGKDANFVVDKDSTMARILPMLLFSSTGSGGDGQSGSGMFGGDNNSMMMLAMAMTLGKK